MHERTRAILHLDLDAFYASIEQRDHPEYRGKPVIVGGSPNRRGVVATASYEARKFGVHAAMPSRTAQRLCPGAIFLPARFEVYRAVSQQIMAIFRQRTPLVLSPYCAELASLGLQRFGLSLTFAAGCCSLSLSESGKPVFLEYPSNSSRLHRRSHRA